MDVVTRRVQSPFAVPSDDGDVPRAVTCMRASSTTAAGAPGHRAQEIPVHGILEIGL